MARSCVLRRSTTTALTNWRRQQCVQGASLSSCFSDQGIAPRHGASLARFLGLRPGAAARGYNLVTGRNLCTGKTLGTAVLDECNNAAPGAYSPSTGTFYSQRPPLKLPEDPCMDITKFVLAGKDEIGSQPALIDARSGHTMTYAELQHAVCAVELGLVGIGVRQKDVVMLVSRNSVHYPVVFLATTSVGGVLSTLNPLCSADEAKRLAETSGARFIVVEEEFVDKVSGLGLPLVIIERGDKVKVGSAEIPFSELLSSDPTCCSAPETKMHQDDPALIVYTSGTTGSSKAVMLSHKNIIAQVLQLAMLDGGAAANSGGTHLSCLPMSHVFGLVVITLQQLYRGATVVVAPKLEMSDATNVISSHKVTHLYALPNSISNLLKIMTTNTSSSASLSSLQRVTSGGAPLGKELIEEFSKHVPDASFVQIYGLTEASGAVALNNLKEDQTPGSVGTLLSGIEARVLNGDKESVGPNVQGELHVRGPNLMKGYVATANASGVDGDGWLSTGDLVTFDEEGRMYVNDRLKEVVYKAHQSSG